MGSVVVVRSERGHVGFNALHPTSLVPTLTQAGGHKTMVATGTLRSAILPTAPHPLHPPPPPPQPPSLVLALIWVPVVGCVDTRLSALIPSCMTCQPDVIVRSVHELFFARFHGQTAWCPAAHAAGVMTFPPSGDGLHHLCVCRHICVSL